MAVGSDGLRDPRKRAKLVFYESTWPSGVSLGFVAMSQSTPLRFAFLQVPEYSLVPFTLAVETLRIANRMGKRELYRWSVVTIDGKPVPAINGTAQIPDSSLDDHGPLDALFVCGGTDPQDITDKRVFAALRRRARHGVKMGALCTGSYVLANAGLLDGYACTIHWENLTGFAEAFPDIEVSSDLFQIDRDRYSCSGGTSSLDMMLHLIALDHGHDLAIAVSEQLIHERMRDAGDHQRMTLRGRLGVSHPKLLTAIGQMEVTLEEPLTLGQLAIQVGLSKRQLERLFRQYLKCTPARYYIELRLKRARMLLEQTSMPVTDVAIACGFVSASHFSRCYREFFGKSPRMERVPA